MAPTYGLAEQAVEIIKAKYDGTAAPGAGETGTINPATRSATETTATPTNTGSSSNNTQQGSAGSKVIASLSSVLIAALVSISFL